MELQFLYSVPEVAIIRANPAQSKSLAVRYGGFVVVWVAAGGMKVLVGSCWLRVEVCFDVPISNSDLRVKELDSFRGPMSGEVDGGMVVVEVSHEVLEVEFSIRPNHKHIINVSPPSQGLQGLRGEEILL